MPLAARRPFTQFEEMTRQNLATYQNALSMFNPFAAGQKSATATGGGDDASEDLQDIKSQMAAMQQQLAALAGKK